MTQTQTPQDRKTLRIAIAGIGVGAKAVMRALRQLPHFELVAAADLREEARDAFERTFGGRTYESVEDLCADPEIDVVWVSTPNHLHDELHRAITEGRPVRHDARWGMATLEVVLAFMQSSKERREIMLSHQCPAY